MSLILDSNSLRNARITLTLILINIFCFIFFNLVLPEYYILSLVQINYRITENLEIWRLFTPMFLHADVMHLFSNMIALFFFGTAVENVYTKFEYLVVYFVSGLIGNLFSLLLLPPFSLSLGASGAIFGLIGAAFIVIAREDQSLLFIALLYLAYFIFSSFSPGINIWAHLFGLAGGLLIGYLFDLQYQKTRDNSY